MATPNRKALDISHHNDVSSWDDVKAAGIVGVIHKATEGTSFIDDQYLKRCAPAMRAGLMWGAYHFANGSDVEAQVNHFLDVVGIDNETLYALDWEDDPNGNTMSVAQAKQFLQLMEQRLGDRRTVVYSGNTAKDLLGSTHDEYIGSHRLWLAQYGSSPVPQASWKTYWLWQYSDGNSGPSPHGCPGVSGDVDTNSWAGSDAELEDQWTGAGTPAPGPTPPPPSPDDSKPTLRKGDKGPYVKVLQGDLNTELMGCHLVVDGDFGSATEQELMNYQRSRALSADGICGPLTWDALDSNAPYVPPPPSLLSPKDQEAIRQIASNSEIQQYNWHDRGIMPPGYCQGMALAFAVSYLQLLDGVSWAVEMAKANTHNSDKDALSWYAGKFKDLGMPIDVAGPDTLRALWTLMLGLGMRESSGRYCCGRDTSAGSSSQTSDTCEAGTFQQSWNSSSSTDEMQELMDEYSSDTSSCYVDTWKQGVSCSASDWECIGSGEGYKFQEMAKNCPTYCAQTCAVGLRNVRQHWGPINRYEAEVKADADKMFNDVQDYLDGVSV